MTSGAAASGIRDAEGRLMLPLAMRAESCADGCRARFVGRAAWDVAPLMPAEVGGFFVVIDGEGDAVDVLMTPFVWIPGGGCRLILDKLGITGGGIAVTTGAMMIAACLASQRGRGSCIGGDRQTETAPRVYAALDGLRVLTFAAWLENRKRE